MDTSQFNDRDIRINPEKLFALVREMSGADGKLPPDDGPEPVGPWGPVIRAAVRHMSIFDPSAELWRNFLISILARQYPAIFDVPSQGVGPLHVEDLLEAVGLNPQPLPPRQAFLESLVQTMVERLEVLQEMAAALSDDGEQRGIIIVSGYISRYIEELCGPGFRVRNPFPGPRPKWLPEELNDLDLLVMAAHFDRAAHQTYSPALQENLAGASVKLLQAALSKQPEQ